MFVNVEVPEIDCAFVPLNVIVPLLELNDPELDKFPAIEKAGGAVKLPVPLIVKLFRDGEPEVIEVAPVIVRVLFEATKDPLTDKFPERLTLFEPRSSVPLEIVNPF
jgi:hypothetical protein